MLQKYLWILLGTALFISIIDGAAIVSTDESVSEYSAEVDTPERTKRSGKGYVRGQTQSQYLNFGKPEQDGKAEAEATENGSRSTVSGSHGMGQAQSQFSMGDCTECGPTSIYEYPPTTSDALTIIGGGGGGIGGIPGLQPATGGPSGYLTMPGTAGVTRPGSLGEAFGPGSIQQGATGGPGGVSQPGSARESGVYTPGVGVSGQPSGIQSPGVATFQPGQAGGGSLVGPQSGGAYTPGRVIQPGGAYGPGSLIPQRVTAQPGGPQGVVGVPGVVSRPGSITQPVGVQIPGTEGQLSGAYRPGASDQTGTYYGPGSLIPPSVGGPSLEGAFQQPIGPGGTKQTTMVTGQPSGYVQIPSTAGQPSGTYRPGVSDQTGTYYGPGSLIPPSVGRPLMEGAGQQPIGPGGTRQTSMVTGQPSGYVQPSKPGLPGTQIQAGGPGFSGLTAPSTGGTVIGGGYQPAGPYGPQVSGLPSAGQVPGVTTQPGGIYTPGGTGQYFIPGTSSGQTGQQTTGYGPGTAGFPSGTVQQGTGYTPGSIGQPGGVQTGQQTTGYGPGTTGFPSGTDQRGTRYMPGSIGQPGIAQTAQTTGQPGGVYTPGLVEQGGGRYISEGVAQPGGVYAPGSAAGTGQQGVRGQIDGSYRPTDTYIPGAGQPPGVYIPGGTSQQPGAGRQAGGTYLQPGQISEQPRAGQQSGGRYLQPGQTPEQPGAGQQAGGRYLQPGQISEQPGAGQQAGGRYLQPGQAPEQPGAGQQAGGTYLQPGQTGGIFSPGTQQQPSGIYFPGSIQQPGQTFVPGVAGTIGQPGNLYEPRPGGQITTMPGGPQIAPGVPGVQGVQVPGGASVSTVPQAQQYIPGSYQITPSGIGGDGQQVRVPIIPDSRGGAVPGQQVVYPGGGAGSVIQGAADQNGFSQPGGQITTGGPGSIYPGGITQQGLIPTSRPGGLYPQGSQITPGTVTGIFPSEQGLYPGPQAITTGPGGVGGMTPGAQGFYPGGSQVPIGGPAGIGTGTQGMAPGVSQIIGTRPGGTQITTGVPGAIIPGQQSLIPGGSQITTVGAPSNIISPAAAGGVDDAFSQAESSIADGQASASAQGKKNGGTAKTQVSGTYSSTGTFSASAMTSDNDRSANAQVSGSEEGAISQSQGQGGAAQSQSQVQVNNKTGGTKASSQSGGIIHQSQSEVQANDKGGLADAQSSGPGQTSSQAQIGFRPRQDGGSEITTSSGGGQASAQSGSHSGQSQSQIHGKSKFGISYHGAAQSASGTKEQVATYREQNRELFHSISQFGGSDAVTDRVDTLYNGPALTGDSEPIPDLQLKASKTSKEVATTGEKHEDDMSLLPEDDDEEIPEDEYDEDEDYYNENAIKMNSKPKSSSHTSGTGTSKTDPHAPYHVYTQNAPTQTQQAAVPNPSDNYSVVQNQNGRVHRYPLRTTTEVVPHGFRGTVNVEKKFHTKALQSHKAENDSTIASVIGEGGGGGGGGGDDGNHTKLRTPDSYVTVTKSITGSMDNTKNPPQENKNFQSTYYTKSSTCGYFTFSCNIVFGANGRSKICRPKAPTNGKC